MQSPGSPHGYGPPQQGMQPYPQQAQYPGGPQQGGPQQGGPQQGGPQQGGPQQGGQWGGHPQQQAGISSGMLVTANHNPLQWMLMFVSPVILINGQKVPLKWGTVPVPVPPGQYHVVMYFPWMFTDGCKTQAAIPVHPGHMTILRYETSFFTFAAGTLHVLGFHPTGM